MNDFFKKFFEQISTLWGKWTVIQKVILAGITLAVIGGLVALLAVSSTPTLSPVIDSPIRDDDARDRIVTRINQEGVRATVNAAGVVQVQDEKTAQRMRAILIREDLIPQGTDPWAIFDRERWTITDFERNVNFQRAQKQLVTDHIRALDDVDNADVEITFPESKLFASEQNPVTASVIIVPKPGSDITQNRKKIQGIQKLLKFAVEGLKDEYIVIADQSGLQLNDFDGLAELDRLNLIEREAKHIQTEETRLRARVLESLQKTFTPDRVRDLNLKIEKDLSQEKISKEDFFPTIIKPRTAGLPYDDSERQLGVMRSQATTRTAWEGTGFNPEGPAGVEGQTPPAFKDMSNLFGKVDQDTGKTNYEINNEKREIIKSPRIDRVTVSVNIDGTWKIKYDEKRNPLVLPDGSIEREYSPVSPEDLRQTQILIQNAIGYNAARGDSVTVHNVQIDRTRQFAEEDTAYFRQKQMQTTIVVFLSGMVILLIGFILFRTISREMERRRQLAEEERSRREQALRDQALMQAEEEGMDVSISVEERTRMELQENVANMAKEHPEDVAQLIRTWLLEE